MPAVVSERVIAIAKSPCERITVEPHSALHTRTGMNEYREAIYFDVFDQITCPQLQRVTAAVREIDFGVSGHGGIADTAATRQYQTAGAIPVTRYPSRAGSAVAVASWSTPVVLTAPSAADARIPVCLAPQIRNDSAGLVVGWLSVVEGDTTAELALWKPGRLTADPIPGLPIADAVANPRFTSSPKTSTSIVSSGGSFPLATLYRWHGVDDNGVAFDRQTLTVSIPTASGWREVFRVDTSSPDERLALIATGYERKSNEAVTCWSISAPGASGSIHVSAADTAGNVRWSIDSLAMPFVSRMQCIPFDSTDFITVAGSIVQHFKGKDLITSYSEGYNLDDNGYVPTYDSLVLAWSWQNVVKAAVINHDGGYVTAWTTINNDGSLSRDLYGVPRLGDGTFAFLSGTARGIYLAGYSRDLVEIQKPAIISPVGAVASNPRAAFRGDSLYIVWQDYRDSSGVPAIYGRAIPMAHVIGVLGAAMPSAGGNIGIAAITPNPARDHAIIRFGASYRTDATLDVADLLGNLLASQPVAGGSSSAVIDTRGLPAGTYIARLHVGASTFSKQFVIIR